MVSHEPRFAVRRHRKVACRPRGQHRPSTERPRHRVRLGFDKVKAGSELELGSVECGAAPGFDGQGKDLRLREELEESRQGRLLH